MSCTRILHVGGLCMNFLFCSIVLSIHAPVPYYFNHRALECALLSGRVSLLSYFFHFSVFLNTLMCLFSPIKFRKLPSCEKELVGIGVFIRIALNL